MDSKTIKIALLCFFFPIYSFGQNLVFDRSDSTGRATYNGSIFKWWNTSTMQSKIDLKANSYEAELFRVPGLTDDEIIQSALNFAGKGRSVLLANKTYNITNEILLDSAQILIGNNSIIKRAPSTFTTLSVSAPNSATSITVSSVPNGWKVGDKIQLYTTISGFKSTVLLIKITSINGNTIGLSRSINSSEDGTITTWPSGAFVRKVYTLITSKYDLEIVNAPFSVYNITFLGNRSNNNQNLYWFVNSTILTRGFGSVIKNCKFYDIPNENIITQGAHVDGNFARSLNGSFVHISGQNQVSNNYEQQNVWITNNFADSTNLATDALSVHSEGLITNSFNGANAIISGNRFFNGSEGVWGEFYPTAFPNSFGSGRAIFADNYCENFKYIIAAFNTGSAYQKGVSLAGNEFKDCGVNDWTNASLYGVTAQSLKLTGTTSITNSSAPITYASESQVTNIRQLRVMASNLTPMIITNTGVNSASTSGTTAIYLGDANNGINTIQRVKQTTTTTATELYSESANSTPSLGLRLTSASAGLYTGGTVKFSIDASGNTTTVGTATIANATANNHAVSKSQMDAADALKANIASPTFTGVPSAPTPVSNVNTTQLVTGAWTNTYYTPLIRSISTGYGLTGGGDLSANRTLVADTTALSSKSYLQNYTYTKAQTNAAIAAAQPQIVDVAGTSQVLAPGNTYIFHNSSTAITASLPVTNPTSNGGLITIIVDGSGRVKITQNAGQFIVSGSATSTVGTAGFVQTSTNNATITLRYVNTNKWLVSSSNSTPTIN